MFCNVCGSKTTVTETRCWGSKRFRRRKCEHCNYIFYTCEEVCNDFEQKRIDAELMGERYRRKKYGGKV